MVDHAATQENTAFVSTEELVQMMKTLPADKLRILNASVKPLNECDVFEEHARARIPGAAFLDLTLVRDLSSPYPFMMPNKDHFIRMMKSLDVRKSQTVVIYETGKGWFATRAAFMLRTFGHPKVLVLDGNFAKWQKEGHPTEGLGQDGSFAEEFDFKLNADSLVSYERVKQIEADGSAQIVDNRPAPSLESAGKIPGSFNVPGPQMLSADGTSKSAEELKQLFESKGIDCEKPMVFTCMAGVLSSLAFACGTKAGFKGPLYFYDGSWSEYSAMKAKESAN